MGRLFNRSSFTSGQPFDDPTDSPWFMRETSPTFVGGRLTEWQDNVGKSTRAVTESSQYSATPKEEIRQSNEKPKNGFLDDYRELIESDEDETSHGDWGWGLEEERFDETKPLHTSEISHQAATTIESKEVVTKSAISRGKRPRPGHHAVQFAGSVMLSAKSNCVDQVLQSHFLDIVTIVEIPHFSHYRQETFESLWYTRPEVEQMKRDYFYWKRIRRSGERNPYAKTVFPPIFESLTSEGKSHNLRFRRHQRTITAIVREQEKQRQMCRFIYGRIVDSWGQKRSSFVLDPERLRDVYTRAGQTVHKQEQALERARRIAEDLPRSTRTGTQSRKQRPEDFPEDPEHREWSSVEASCSSFWWNVSTPASHCVRDVLGVLLSPFLDQKNESFFLDIGNEMIVYNTNCI